jgi:hypothetical protein
MIGMGERNYDQRTEAQAVNCVRDGVYNLNIPGNNPVAVVVSAGGTCEKQRSS